MESNREFNSGRLFVAEQLSRLYQAEYEAIFGPLPPLDDATRFPQLSPDNAGCVEVNTSKGSHFVCRGLPGDGADYDGMTAGDQALVSAVAANAGKALEAYVRQLRCGASRFDAWLDGDASALDRERATRRRAVRGPSAMRDVSQRPTFDRRRLSQRRSEPGDGRGRDPRHGRSRRCAGHQRRVEGPNEQRGPVERRRPPSRCRAHRDRNWKARFARPVYAATRPTRASCTPRSSAASTQVVEFFDRGGDGAGHYPGTNELTPLGLSEQQKADLVAFLGTLNGPGADATLRAPRAKVAP